MAAPNYELWIESYAELLCCDPRPEAVAVAIQSIQAERDRIAESIPSHRKSARDAVIRQMRETGVNCGNRSRCAVSGWFKLSTEGD